MSTLAKTFCRWLPVVGAVACISAGTGGAASAAPVPCWKSLLNEWYTGRISTIYQHYCYVQAISHLPVDVQVYSSARQDIQAAEIAAAHHKKAPAEKTTTPAVVVHTAHGTTTVSGTTTDQNPPKKKTGLIGVLDDLTPGNPQSFPLPLLVLGALAILLVIAGGVGMIWQRTHPGDSDQTEA